VKNRRKSFVKSVDQNNGILLIYTLKTSLPYFFLGTSCAHQVSL